MDQKGSKATRFFMMMILMLLWKLSLILQEVNNMNDYQKHVCRDYHCLKVRFSFFQFVVCFIFQFISLSLPQWKNMKTILNLLGFMGAAAAVLLILQSRYNKRTTTPNTVSKSSCCTFGCWDFFCLFVIQAQQQTRLCIKKKYPI